MAMLEALCIIVGIICLVWGLVASITGLVIVGVIFLALGGVWVFIFDGDFDLFD